MERKIILSLLAAAFVALAGCATQESTPGATDDTLTNTKPGNNDGGTTPAEPTPDGATDETPTEDDSDDAIGDDNATEDDAHDAPKARHALALAYPTTENGTGNESIASVHFWEVGGKVYVYAVATDLTTGEHGFHVHAVGDCGATTTTEGAKVPGGAAGGHFNPTNASHGMHAGDLGNLVVGADGVGSFSGVSSAITLAPDAANSILGLSVVIHANKDDGVNLTSAGARVACGTIEAKPDLAHEDVHEAHVDLHAVSAAGVGNMTGTVHFVQVGMEVFVVVNGKDLAPGKHGVHIHQNGNCGVTTGADNSTIPAGAAGGHFNPTNASHGMHAGDLGNILIGEDGTGTLVVVTSAISLVEGADDSVIGRSVVVHAGEDDGVDIASAGARVQCGTISAYGDDHAH